MMVVPTNDDDLGGTRIDSPAGRFALTSMT
jgi:hypothetical protein